MAIVTTTLLSSLDTHADLSSSPHRLSGLSINVGVGMNIAQQTGFKNTTDPISDAKTYPPTKENPTVNTYAKFSPAFKQALAAKVGEAPNTLDGTWATVPNCYVTESTEAAAYLPTPPENEIIYIFIDDKNKVEQTSLAKIQRDSASKQVDTVTPFLDYSQISSLNGASGIDVKGGFGYKFYISDTFYMHPTFNFGYCNTTSNNAVDSIYQKATFDTRAIKARYVTAQTDTVKEGAATPTGDINPATYTQTIYSIDPDTNVTQGVGSSLKNALTFERQWYWNFDTSLGYQLREGISVEAIVGYQMTRCKLTVKEVSGDFQNLGATFDKGSPDSTILNAISLNNTKSIYRFGEDLTEAEESAAKMISGLVLGFGVNFAIANNLTMGVSLTNVFNMAREFEIDDIQIAPTAKSTAKTAAAGATGTGTAAAGTAASGTTAQSSEQIDPATTSFTAKMSQNQTSFLVNLTYFFPMGSDHNPGA